MTEEEALKKALGMKARQLMKQAEQSAAIFESLGIQLARGDPALIAGCRKDRQEGLVEAEDAIIRGGNWALEEFRKRKKSSIM
jgi:hypothetical protein